jgi:hypothetical protein
MDRACARVNVRLLTRAAPNRAGRYDGDAMNRRAFAVTAFSALNAARVSGANDRIRIGLIGSGGRGREDWGTFLKPPDVEPVVVATSTIPSAKRVSP